MGSKRALERVARPGFADDVRSLPTPNLQRRAIQIWVDVSNGSLEGLPLEGRASTGDLSDCRKAYFDEREGPPRYRLVYRLLPHEATAVCVEAVAVGYRDLLHVYRTAAQRLGREVGD